tara:strand:- start:2120 stop:3124 length:1005 start_codon:yes stop_codon:yes gene_type:complete
MRNKLKKLCIFLVLFTTSFLINLYSQDLLGKELVKIRFATDWRAQAEQGGFYHALALGLYKERGLDVKIIQGNAGINIPRLLGSGEIEFGMGSNSFIPLNIIANNIPAKSVMASFQKDPQILMAHPSSPLRSLEDMKDKPIMISEASIGAFWVWLKSKYSFTDKQIRRKTFSLAPFLVNRNAIQQGYLTSEPYLVKKELGESPNIFLLSDYGYPSYGAMILARNDLIEERPEIVKAFVEASIIGWKKYIYEDPEVGNNLILNENSEMTEEILLQAIGKIKKYNLISNRDDYSDVGLMTEERWNEFYITMSNNGIYKKDLNWKDSYSLQFISEGE